MFIRDRITQLKTTLSEGHPQPSGIYFYLNYVIRLAVQVWRQLIAHKCLQQASSLAFSTLICLIPLSAIALFFLKTQNEQSKFIVYIRDNFLPGYQAEELTSRISEIANKVGGLNSWRFLLLLLISLALFSSVEKTFNDIWHTRSRLSFFQKYAIFYTILMIAPVLIGVSISVSANWLGAYLLPWMSIYVVFILMYKALPNTVVRWKPVLAGAFIAGTLFQVARWIFGFYLANIVGKSYGEIYGVLALLPILAIWIYIAWVITLTGAEIAHAVQNLKRRGFGDPVEEIIPLTAEDHKIAFITPTLAIRLFLTIAEHFYQGNGAYPKSEIMLKYGLPRDLVNRIFKRFKAEGLIYEVEGDTSGYLPARALSDMTLDQVIDAFESDLEGFLHNNAEFPAVTEQILDQLRAAPREVAQNRSIEELLAPAELTKVYPG
ncbi:MAG: YihY family inner membrane protein [Candidatus Poribacteria bacterium]|nr:YihY family inner membrane protein [Candidatus Poribacteria bacterium]